MNASSQNDRLRLHGQLWLWIGPLLPPVGWFSYLLVNYLLVSYACTSGMTLLLYITTLITLLTTAGAGIVAWRVWQEAEPKWPDETSGVMPRTRFLAVLGFLSGGLFFLVVLAQGIPTLMVHPCQP